jgi:hypothetical protein
MRTQLMLRVGTAMNMATRSCYEYNVKAKGKKDIGVALINWISNTTSISVKYIMLRIKDTKDFLEGADNEGSMGTFMSLWSFFFSE